MIEKKNLQYMILLVIFLSGFFLRVYPATQYNMPLKYDSYYHLRVAELIKEQGTIPLYEPWPYGGRPHIYPPAYHLLIIATNVFTGIDILDIVRFLLPIVSALTILVVYWLVRKFSNETSALLSAFFVALNPYLISSSYDSPQVIGIMLLCFALYYLLKNKHYPAGLILGIAYLFDTLSALTISAVFVIYMLLSGQTRKIPKILVFPAIFAAIWYLPRVNLLYCYNNFIGSYFIAKSMGTFMMQEAVIAVSAVLIGFALTDKIKTGLHKFYAIWVVFFTALLLSFVVTSSFHPWRQSTFLSFGFSIFLALSLDALRPLKKIFFTTIFSLLLLLGIAYMALVVQSFTPPLSAQEYMMIDWADKNLPQDSVILAQHDLCANLLALTNKSCVLDISFECIANKTSFYDYENFFFAANETAIKETLATYPVTDILYRWNQYQDELIDRANVQRIYSSWTCTAVECEKSAAVYKVIR